MPSLCVVSSSLHQCPSHEDRSDMYHLSFPKDTWTPKLLVYGTYILETAQTIIVTYDIFNTYARHFGDLAALDQLQNEWIAIPFMTSISTTSSSVHFSTSPDHEFDTVSATVQLYYAYRIGILSESKLLRIGVSVVRPRSLHTVSSSLNGRSSLHLPKALLGL